MGPRKGQPLHSGSSCKSLTQEGFLSLFAEAMQEGRGGKEFPRAPLLAQRVKKLFMFPGKFISSVGQIPSEAVSNIEAIQTSIGTFLTPRILS